MTPQPPSTTVSGGTPPSGATTPPQQPPAQQPPAVDVAALKAELDALKGRIPELERGMQFWHEKATKGTPAPEKPADEEPEVDVLELAAKGGKAFNSYLEGWAKKNGFVKGDDMQSAINAKAAQISKEAELMQRYPDLKKQDSDFFKSAAGHFGKYKESGMSEHMAMELAAERAELEMLRSGKIKTPQQQSDDAKTQREADRLARIKAQGGERGNRAPIESEDDDELTPEQKHIARSMGITEDAYKARAKKGVALRGR